VITTPEQQAHHLLQDFLDRERARQEAEEARWAEEAEREEAEERARQEAAEVERQAQAERARAHAEQFAILEVRDKLTPAPIRSEASRIRRNEAARRYVAGEQGAFGIFDPSRVMAGGAVHEEEGSRDLIGGMLATGELAALSGRSYSGKSFLALDWSFCLAAGIPWHGRAVEKTRVLYLRMEGANDWARRIRALEAHHGAGVPDGLIVWAGTVSFFDPANPKGVAEFVRNEGIGLVVTDTLSRAFAGQNENEPAAMGTFVQAATQIREATPDTTHLLIHHPNQSDEMSLRGHGSLFAAVDRQWVLTAPGGRRTEPDRVLVSQKVKSGRLAADVPLAFATEGESAVLIPGRSTTTPPAHRAVVEALGALGGTATRDALATQLTATGAYRNKNSARNAIRRAIEAACLIELGEGVMLP